MPRCPHCHSNHVRSLNYARRIGRTLGTASGIAAGVSATLRGARYGSQIVSIAGPQGRILGGMTGAILGTLIWGVMGGKAGATLGDVLAADAVECAIKAGAKTKPAAWEATLAMRVAAAFGCRLLFSPVWLLEDSAKWLFIGCDPAAEIGSYAFSVLFRQCKRARAEHIKTGLKRCKAATKTRRADLFCEGWMSSVVGKINAFAGTDEQRLMIDAYMAKHHPSIGTGKTTDRNGQRRLSDRDYNDYASGIHKGKDAQLNRGVDGAEQRVALGSGALS